MTSYGPVFATAADATGGILALEPGTADVGYASVQDLAVEPDLLADALELPSTGRFRHGYCWGLLVPDGSRSVVVVLGRESGDLDGEGIVVGLLSTADSRRTVSLWGPRPVRVSVLVEATAGLLGYEVRFRTAAPAPVAPPSPPPVRAPEQVPVLAPVAMPVPAPEPLPVPMPVPAPEPVGVGKPEPAVVPEPAVAPEPAIVPGPAFVPEPAVLPGPEPEPAFVPEPAVVPRPEPEPAFVPEPAVVPRPEPMSEPEPFVVPEPEPVVVPEPEHVLEPEPRSVAEPVPVAPVRQVTPASDLGRLAPPRAPAGWYGDPLDAVSVRWWDGTRWSADTAPRPTASDQV